MTELLKQAYDKVSTLPEEIQDRIARELLEDIDSDAHWKKVSDQLRTLVENSQVEEAREVLATVPPGVSEELDAWLKVLPVPKAYLSPPESDGNSKLDVLWIHHNADKYKGKWVAIKNGELLGADESRIELRNTLKSAGNLKGATFFHCG